jgi:YD repeat-containing protein
VVDPSGSTTRHIFSNKFDITESQLLRTEFYAGAAGSSALLRSEDSGYAPPNTANLPASAGTVLAGGVNVSQLTKYAPLNQRVITQDGQRYTWQALAFDAYAQPTDVKRYNDIAGQAPIEETTRYLNDTSAWVLGLPLSVTNVATGELETSNTYNSLDELTARARFGQVLMSYAWNGAGQLASFTDGNGHTTTLGNYYRGVPRTIGYPDGTSETLAVDDLGQITAITDQTGHTTSYGYDAIGRIAQISYPHDSRIDSASWYPKVFSYAYVTGAERGVAAGHWRRTVTQGNATDTTWFDAELRPVLHDTGNGQEDISTATGYDWRGQTTFASYPVAGSPALSAITTGTRSVYDALGRLIQSQQDTELGTLTTTTAYLAGARK